MGALFCFDRGARGAIDHFDQATTRVGYTSAKERSEIEVMTAAGERSDCVRIDGIEALLSLAIARRVASSLKKPVRAITVTVVPSGKSDEDFDCAVDDVELAANGTRRRGPWADQITDEHGSDWGQICDAKYAALVDALLSIAGHEIAGLEGDVPSFARRGYLTPPATIGTPRLDEIAKRVRVAERAQLTTVAGRPCVRVSDTGSTVTSFVEPSDVETLRAVLGALLE